jgi:ATP-dependent helicase/DNAse subunit B
LDDRLEPEEDYDVAQLGSIYHLILEKLFSNVEQKQDIEALQEALPIIAAEIFRDAPNKFGFRTSPLWVVQQKEILRTLSSTLIQLVGISQNWWPTYFEHRFGFSGTPPLAVVENGEEYLFRGSIDRIDVHQTKGRLRVIDYKTASSMNNKDFIEQKKLQFVLYAMAVEDLFKLGPVSDSIYFSINAGKIIGPNIKDITEENDIQKRTMFAAATQTVAQFVTQIRAGEFMPTKPEDGCPSYCPASSWCWHYVPKDI